MPGTKNMLFGALWAAGGLLVTGVTYAAASRGGTYVVAYGAVVVGAIQFVIGVIEYLAYQAKGTQGKRQVHAEASAKAIVRAMLAVAAADGKVEDEEVATIAAVYEKVFGSTLEPEWIKKNADELIGKGTDVVAAIRDDRGIIDAELVPLVFKAACLVAGADGTLDDRESTFLNELAGALGMTEERVQGCLSEVQHAA